MPYIALVAICIQHIQFNDHLQARTNSVITVHLAKINIAASFAKCTVLLR